VSVIVDESDIERLLAATRRIAVVGAHPDRHKPAHFVPQYLSEHGYTVIPVNPDYPDELLWGRPPLASLHELDEQVEVVLVFRRREHLSRHADEVLTMSTPPTAVWFQQGIRDDAVADRLSQAGIDVVQDACMMIMHRRLDMDDAVSL
jgi:uncharacterized protein